MALPGFFREERGVALAFTALMLILAAGAAALAIDLGHLFLVKSELQRTADAGAMAAAQGLLSIPPGTTGLVSLTPDCSRGLAACRAIVAANKVDGAAVQVLGEDVVFGQWDAGAKVFVPIGTGPPQQINAVQVVVRKDRRANDSVALLFAGLFFEGWQSVELSARAVALVGFPGYIPAGSHAFPLAIDASKTPPQHAAEPVVIHLNPTPGDNCIWHTFDDRSPGASDLRSLIDGSVPSPPLRVGDLIKVTEGVADSVLQELAHEFNHQGSNWTVLAPVISPDSHTGWAEVLGFVAFRITRVVNEGDDKFVEGYTVPDYVAPGTAPGGPNYGMRAAASRLVQ